MKKLFALLTLFTTLTFSQEKNTEKSNIFYYHQDIKNSDFANKEFILTVATRCENYLENSRLDIGIVEKDENFKYVNFKNLFIETNVKNKDWKTYTIKGTFKPNSKNFNLLIICRNKGDFYFDDISLKVKKKSGKWNKIEIKNPGFESEINLKEWSTDVKGTYFEPINFTYLHTNFKPYKGKSCLLIKGGDILGSSSEGKFVNVNGVSLYYEMYGEGEPLLLLHGNGQSIDAFNNQVEEYAKHYKVIIVDCRGRGNSTYQNDVELTFDVEIEDLKQFLDKLNISKTHIVGWSDGGILGILLAIKHPEKVDKMVSMAGNIFPDGLVNKEILINYVKQYQELNTNHKFDKEIDFLYLDYKYPNLEFEELKVIKSKCLIMAGDKDEIKTEHTVKIFENIPNAQLAIVPNSTHYLPSENPKLFNEIVLRFLKQ
jgi:pimeloyl-ACP methyl ester carboxylesterase